MRELYILAVGIAVGLSLGELLEAYERRVAYRAADIAEDTIALRRSWRRGRPDPDPAPEAPAPGAEPAPA